MSNFQNEVFIIRNIIPGKSQGEQVSDAEVNELFDRVAEKLFPIDGVERNQFSTLIHAKKITIGTSILTNISGSQSLNACTVLNADLRQNFTKIKKQIEKSSIAGMGVGFSLDSTEEPTQELYKLNKVLQDVSKKCRRSVAGITNLDAEHPKVVDYIESKRNADFNTFKFNISVSAGDQFMTRIIENKASEKDQQTFTKIAENMHYSGEPGILFLERMQKENPVPEIKFESFSPCAELPMGKGEACQFSYINLGKMIVKDQDGNKSVNWSSIDLSSRILTQALDKAIEISIENSVFDTQVLEAKRRIGIGVCGYADLLIELGINYGSMQGNALLQKILSLMNYSSKDESMQIAKQKGSFGAFSTSKYMTDEQYLMRFSKQGTISFAEWQELNKKIMQQGLRHSSTISLPPTGNSSLIVGASNSIEPYFSLINPFTKKLATAIINYVQDHKEWDSKQKKDILYAIETGETTTIFKEYPELAKLLRTALEINPQEHLSVVIAAQPCIDDAISKTINLNNTVTAIEIEALIKKAYLGGVKGITLFRDGCLSERSVYKPGDVLEGNSRLN